MMLQAIVLCCFELQASIMICCVACMVSQENEFFFAAVLPDNAFCSITGSSDSENATSRLLSAASHLKDISSKMVCGQTFFATSLIIRCMTPSMIYRWQMR